MREFAVGLAVCASLSAFSEPFKDGDTVVFFGDSITHAGRYHEFVTDFYRTRFPEAKIRFVNSGVGGDSAKGALPRIAVDVAAYKPTWVGFHFGMNDIGRSDYTATPSAEQLVRADAAQTGYRSDLAALVAAVRKAVPGAKPVYFTPTIYDDTAVPTNIPPDATGWAVVNQVGCNAGLGLMAGHVLAAARRDGVLGVDWYTPLQKWLMARRPHDPHYMLTGWDRVHPGALGHSIMAWCFLKQQGVPATVSDIALDAASGRVTRSENAAVGEVAKTADGIACTVLAKALPFPVPPEAREALGEFAVEETLNREVFAVSGLKPGEYALCIDGVEVVRADAETLAKGVGLGFNEKTPQYRQAQDFFVRNAELAQREVKMRNAHAARWAYGMWGAPVDDLKAFAEWFEKNEKDKTGFFATCVPAYLEYWPHYRETRDQLWSDQEAARKMVCPVSRRYEVKRLGPASPVKIVLDTDMLVDSDDVGALACLHAMADAGECEILATVSSTRGNASVGALEVINSYYGRGDLPVGAPKGMGVTVDASTSRGHQKYRRLCLDYPKWVKYPNADDSPDANEVYRRVLAASPDGSVVICTVGFLTNLRRLLETKGDGISPLDGKTLVAKKVKRWVAMACFHPRGKECNSMMDWQSSKIVFETWPTAVVVSDFQYGADVFAGRAVTEQKGPRNPVKDIFAGEMPTREQVLADPAKWKRSFFGLGGRSAWDETAVLAAVRGAERHFDVCRGRYRMIGADGENEWTSDEENGSHVRLVEKTSKTEVAAIIDELICRGVKDRQNHQ